MVTDLLGPRAEESQHAAPTAAQLLIALLGAPTAWSVHLFAIYSLVGIECNGGMSAAALAISLIGATLVLGAVALFSGMTAYRLVAGQQTSTWRTLGSDVPSRRHFFAGTGLLLSAIFVLMIVFQAITPLLTPMCAEMLRVAK